MPTSVPSPRGLSTVSFQAAPLWGKQGNKPTSAVSNITVTTMIHCIHYNSFCRLSFLLFKKPFTEALSSAIIHSELHFRSMNWSQPFMYLMQEWELRAPDVIPVGKVASLQPANWGPAKQESVCQKPRVSCKIQGKISPCLSGRTKETPPHSLD